MYLEILSLLKVVNSTRFWLYRAQVPCLEGHSSSHFSLPSVGGWWRNDMVEDCIPNESQWLTVLERRIEVSFRVQRLLHQIVT